MGTDQRQTHCPLSALANVEKASSFVLASLKASTYGRRWQGAYPLACDRSERFKRSLVCTSSPLRSLRPSWKAFLNILIVFFNVLSNAKRAKPTPTTPR
jgi:hypothetical protein